MTSTTNPADCVGPDRCSKNCSDFHSIWVAAAIFIKMIDCLPNSDNSKHCKVIEGNLTNDGHLKILTSLNLLQLTNQHARQTS